MVQSRIWQNQELHKHGIQSPHHQHPFAVLDATDRPFRRSENGQDSIQS
jgi:hypothetical protein